MQLAQKNFNNNYQVFDELNFWMFKIDFDVTLSNGCK